MLELTVDNDADIIYIQDWAALSVAGDAAASWQAVQKSRFSPTTPPALWATTDSDLARAMQPDQSLNRWLRGIAVVGHES